MKKLISVITIFVMTLMVAQAQVVPFDGNLADAIKKAKNEDKNVVILASTTWCGPCKQLENTVYPTKETGNLLNNETVFVKYYLDKEDPDNIVSTYGVQAYPTFIVVNGEGVEVNRFVGGAADAAGFNERVKSAINPENSYQAYEKRYKDDISTGYDYATFLASVYKNADANRVVNEVFKAREDKDNFSAESLEFYKSFITDPNHIIIKHMLDKKTGKEVKKLMGKDAYAAFFAEMSNKFVSSFLFTRQGLNMNGLNGYLELTKKNTVLKTDFIKFVSEYKDAIANREASTLFPVIKELMNEDDGTNVDIYASIANSLLNQQNVAQYKGDLIEVFNIALQKTKNEQQKGAYNYYINALSNM